MIRTGLALQPRSVAFSADSVVRHDLADIGPFTLCRGEMGCLVDGLVNCWECRTLRAGGDPNDPAADPHPASVSVA